MKANLPQNVAEKCILALKEGKEIGIIVGSLTQKFLAESFPSLYEQGKENTNSLWDRLKGPL